MIKEQDIAKVFNQLNDDSSINFVYAGNDVTIQAIDHASKLSLSTNVYFGMSYIPMSVRNSASSKAPFVRGRIPTYLTIDNDQYTITLHFLGNLEVLDSSSFKFLIEEFALLADEWRHYLDDLDNNDRVYIYHKK